MKKFLFLVSAVLILALAAGNALAAQTVRLGVTGSVYDELWAAAKKSLADEGINLEIIQFTDYVTPNRALNDGDIDLNGFQHRIYFADELSNRDYNLTNIANLRTITALGILRKISLSGCIGAELPNFPPSTLPLWPTNPKRILSIPFPMPTEHPWMNCIGRLPLRMLRL